MIRVIVTKVVYACDRNVELQRDVVLPFTPFIDLILVFEDGFEEAVEHVLWNVEDRVFTIVVACDNREAESWNSIKDEYAGWLYEPEEPIL